METIDVVVMGRKTFGTLLGGGDPLFADLEQPPGFELVDSRLLLGQTVRRRYRRKRACPLVQKKVPIRLHCSSTG